MSRTVTVLAAAFIACVPAAQGAVILFEHLPEANSTFVSHHTVGGPVIADDFDATTQGGGVTFAEWWGTAAQSSGWELVFHFGQLSSGGFGQPQANPTSAGGKKYFVTSTGVDPDGDGIFYYSAALPGDFIIQQGPRTLGTEYWFTVANEAGGWSWAFAGSGPTVGDEHWNAVVSSGSTPCGDNGPHCGAWSQLQGRDFAFRLSTPEPGTWSLLTAGLILLAFGARRVS